MPTGLHLLLAVALAALASRLPRGGAWSLLALAALVFVPLAQLPSPLGGWLGGTEGLGEAATVGLLLAVAWRAARELRWLVVPALLLAGEELSWLQPLLGYPTPAFLSDWGSRSTELNLHNLPAVDPLWRLGPLVGVLLSSRLRRPWLPRLSGWTALSSLLLVGVFAVGSMTALERAVDEAVELGLVLAVWLGWETRAEVSR